MATSNPGSPNLSGSYENIQSALRTKGNLEGKRTSDLGIANAVAAPVVEEIQTRRAISEKRNQAVFEKTLEDELNNRDFERQLKKEGRLALDDDEIAELETGSGLSQGSLRALRGRLLTAEETEKIISKAVQAQADADLQAELATEPKKGKLLSTAARAAGPGKAGEAILKQELGGASGGGRKTVNILNERTGKTHVIPVGLVNEDFDTATFPFEKFPLAGYKDTVTKDPRTGEVITVSGTAGVTGNVTGPVRPVDEDGFVRAPEQLNVFERQKFSKTFENVQKNKVVDKGAQTLATLNPLQALLLSNTSAGTELTKSLIARGIATEVGRLTDFDVERASGSQDLASRFGRLKTKALTGKMLDTDRDEFIELIQTISENTVNNMNTVVDAVTDRELQTLNKPGREFDKDFVKSQISINYNDLRPARVFKSIADLNKASLPPGTPVYVYSPKDKKYKRGRVTED